VATLILPADVSWEEGGVVAAPAPFLASADVSEQAVGTIAELLAGDAPATLLLGGQALSATGLALASGVARACGAKLYVETFPARLARGAGVVAVERLAYLGEMAAAQLAGSAVLVCVGALPPVTFFGYPGRDPSPVPAGCGVHVLAGRGEDCVGALERLAARLGVTDPGAAQPFDPPDLPAGELSPDSAARVIAALLPENAIVADEANTSGIFLPGATAGAHRHDLLTLTGGAIGQGIPVATGAAVACPDRPVLCLEADGSAMYTIAGLWTQAREGLDVTTVIFSNRSYAILNMELHRVGANAAGPRAADLLDLSRPELDFAALADGMGVPGVRVHTAEEFAAALLTALAEPGPHLVEAVLPGFG
jgi:acetolactate synthase-1/2/3 large subunit